MASGKQTPRQAMINMMYLVLTALLALNVSKEILDSFVTVNNGLENTKSSLNDKMKVNKKDSHDELTTMLVGGEPGNGCRRSLDGVGRRDGCDRHRTRRRGCWTEETGAAAADLAPGHRQLHVTSIYVQFRILAFPDDLQHFHYIVDFKTHEH